MNFSFHPLASTELENSINFFESQSPGLGLEFAEVIYSTIERILQFPLAWSLISPNCRRCLVHRFPFGIIYQIREDDILIIAIMQLNRDPSYWINRI
jgi:cytochrome P450